MSKINLSELQAKLGTKLGRSIYNENGRLLLTKGVILQASHLDKLIAQGIEEVYLDARSDPNIPMQKLFQERNSSLPPTSAKLNPRIGEIFTSGQEIMGDLFARAITDRPIRIDNLSYTVDILNREILATNNILIQLQHLRNKDAYTLQHSFAVSILCVKIGQMHNLPDEILKQLGMAGLLHDIGKARIPTELLNKPTPLTPEEYAELKKHPILSYQILRNAGLFDQSVEVAVLQHHERSDGSGYPLRASANQIHPFAKIIAIADTFDALTSDRLYAAKKSPFSAAQEIQNASFAGLDPIITQRFLRHFLNVSVGEIVRLNNGNLAEIILLNQHEPHRPFIITQDNQFIDLTKNRALEIQEVLQ